MIGTARHLLFDVAAVLALLAWTAALVGWQRWYRVAAPACRRRAPQSRPALYADIEDIVDSLDDLAREHRWDLAKRFAIARLACENRTVTIAALERQYQIELRAVSDAPASGNGSRPPIG